jgi:hypothetical protein
VPSKSKILKLFVRRGAQRRFQKLKEKTADLPVEVSWDRRGSDRRSGSDHNGPDRRKHDRRQKPPFTWDVSDFVVAAKAPRRKKK